jgi:hypothetical protein
MLEDLKKRQGFPMFNEADKFIFDNDKKEIDSLNNKIASNACFIRISENLSDQEKENIFRIKWKIEGGIWKGSHWSDIGIQLGFSEATTKYYRFLCSFAHSGFLSALQMNEVLMTGDESPPLGVSVKFIKIVLAKMINLYCDFFPISKSILDNDSEANALVQKYSGLAKSFLKKS